MKVIIIGVGGFIGSYLFDAVNMRHEVIGTSTHNKRFKKLDISEFGKTSRFLKGKNPDVICLPAGITNLDYIEKNPNISEKINVLGTENIVNYCSDNDCRLIFFSSDAIFDGKMGPYYENDAANPISIYGKQKFEAENIVKKLDDFAIIRTSSVYGWDKKKMNFVSRLIDSLENNKKIKAPTDQFYTPTYVIDLVNAAIKLMNKKFNGIYNIAGPDFMSRYKIALNVCRIFGFEKELVVPVESSELNQTAKRPKYGGLINKKALKELGIKLCGLKEGLIDMKSGPVW
ncbi:SDR family oxidoreductase [Candidatus Woesearchaeota archaeon]|nr:SDR family oxidoreductase [Candidatus Woesearchaeota archaeon]